MSYLGYAKLLQFQQVEGGIAGGGGVHEVENHDGYQHQHAASHGVEDELQRSVDPPLTAPHADEEVHGNEGDLPEDIEQEEIEGGEDPDHAHLQKEHEDVILLDPFGDGRPRGKDGHGREKGGQQHQEEADAVHTQVVANSQAGNPGDVFLELHPCGLWPKVEEEGQREQKVGHGHAQSQPPDESLLPGIAVS